jgi:hypothetical protein
MEARGPSFRSPGVAFQSTNPAFTEENCRRGDRLVLMPTFSPFTAAEAADVISARVGAELRGLHAELVSLTGARARLIRRAGGVYVGRAVVQPSGVLERDLDACLAGLDSELAQLGWLSTMLRVSCAAFAAGMGNAASAVSAAKAARQNRARLLDMARSVGVRPPSGDERKLAELNLAENLRKLREAVSCPLGLFLC